MLAGSTEGFLRFFPALSGTSGVAGRGGSDADSMQGGVSCLGQWNLRRSHKSMDQCWQKCCPC